MAKAGISTIAKATSNVLLVILNSLLLVEKIVVLILVRFRTNVLIE